jgi:hypothetical protein
MFKPLTLKARFRLFIVTALGLILSLTIHLPSLIKAQPPPRIREQY